MHKYLAFFKFKFLQQLQFRGEFFLWFVLDLIPFGVLFIVMKTIYQQAEVIHTYRINDIIFYYFAVVFIDSLILTHFEGWRVEEIKNGKIDGYLLRPFSYIKEIIISDLAKRAFSLMLFLPIYFLFYWITQRIVSFSLPQLNVVQLLSLIIFLGFAYFMELAIGLIIVILGFWFEGSQGLEHFKWIGVTIFSGSMVPLEFLPTQIQKVANILPFKYMFAVPINILQGRDTFHPNDFLIISITIVFFSIFVSILWKKAIFQYTSSGG